jgi:hypothetical protein
MVNYNVNYNSIDIVGSSYRLHHTRFATTFYFTAIFNNSHEMTLQQALYVHEYLLVHKEGHNEALKRMKRKLTKRKSWKCFTTKSYKALESDSPLLFKDFLLHIKKLYHNKPTSLRPSAIGFITDQNALTHDINLLPPPPTEWDILCIEGQVDNYDFNDAKNTIYWCKSNVSLSRNIVVRYDSIDTILGLIKQKEVKTWSDFISNANSLDVFMITQYQLSTCSYENKIELQAVDFKPLITKFNDWYNLQSPESQYKVWPRISMLCVLKDPHRFYHTLNTFLRLRYPRDLLELVVVDDQDSDKKLKHMLPNDSRIKFVNISKKDAEDNYIIYPFGHKLNLGVKYATHDVICHMFDDHVYFPNKFDDLVKTYLLSNKEALISVDTAYFEHTSDAFKSVVESAPDLGNMMYTKKIWKVGCFEESSELSSTQLAKAFVANRVNCFGGTPFAISSFCIAPPSEEADELPFSLSTLVPDTLKESFKLLF